MTNTSLEIVLPTAAGCSYSFAKEIEIFDKPKPFFTASPTAGAAPLFVEFNNASTGALTYRWEFSDTEENIVTFNATHVFEMVGQFEARLYATNTLGCEQVWAETIDAQEAAPDVAVNRFTLVENTDGTYKGIVTLQNNGNTVLQNLPVTIDISGLPGFDERVAIPLQPGALYNLILSTPVDKAAAEFMCARVALEGDLNPDDNLSCVALDEGVTFFPAYPNPAVDELNVEWIAGAEGGVDITLFDALGKKIIENRVSAGVGLNRQVLSVTELRSGLFTLVIKSGNRVKTQNIFIKGKN